MACTSTPPNGLGTTVFGCSGEEEFVIFPSVQCLLQGGPGVDGQGFDFNFRGQPTLLTQVRKIGRESVAEVNGRGGETAAHKLATGSQAGLRIEMWMPLAALVLFAKGGWMAFQRQQLGGGSPQGSSDINQVPWTGAGAQQRPPLGHAAQQNDVGNHQTVGAVYPRRRLGQVPACQRNLVPLSQSHQPVEESLHPSFVWRPFVVSGQLCRQSERKKGRLRASSHGGQVAQAARQAAMAHALRWMPIATEMNIFEGEVGGNHQLFSGPWPQHSAIVADA